MGAKTSKCYSFLKSLLNLFNLFLNVLINGPHKELFWNFEVRFLKIFLISSLYPMETPKTSIIWQMSNRRVKWSELWASWVSIQCTQGTFDISVIKVILGLFSAF